MEFHLQWRHALNNRILADLFKKKKKEREA